MSRVLIPTDPYAGKPIRSLQTMLRLLATEDDSLPRVIPDGIYGPTTLQAVGSFQRRAGLPVTGIADGATWLAMQEAHDRTLPRQSPAEPLQIWLGPGQFIDEEDQTHIWLVQAMLRTVGENYTDFPAVALTGSYDDQTRAAVTHLQQRGGLYDAPAGSIDAVTWGLLVQFYRAVTTDTATAAL